MELQPSSINSSDSSIFKFETFLSDDCVFLPKEGSSTSVELELGIRIINCSPQPKRFLNYYLSPEIINSSLELVHLIYASSVYKLIDESNFELVEAGESVTFQLNSRLFLCQDKLLLSIEAKDGGMWTSLESLGVGSYQIRFHYKTEVPVGQIFLGRNAQGSPIYRKVFEFDDLWTGSVSSPYKSFSLVFQ